MKKRGAFLLTTFLLTLLIFMMAKVAFMLSYTDSEPFTLTDMLQVLQHGLSLDIATSLYVMALPFLLTLASVWVPLPRWILKIYFAVIAAVMSLAFVADTSLYAFWHFKLDASCLGYLATPEEAMASVTTGYLLVRFVVWLLVSLFIYALYARLIVRIFPRSASFIASRASQKRNAVLSPILETLLYILFIPLIVIGIRGGLDESTTNIGQVYYSPNQFLNHSAVNPAFSFLSSLDNMAEEVVSYDYFTEEECEKRTEGLFDTRSIDPDTLLNTTRPNILVIIMESCGGQFTKIGGHPEITPRLNQLADESIAFTECYANSWRTDKGVVSILSGYPAFPITSVMKIPEKSRKLPSIASALQQEGYATSFFYGGDINFTNMRGYLMSTGYERLHWKADYSSEEQGSAQWGVRDDLMFGHLLNDIKDEKADHWMKTILTLSSHEPWDVPTRELDDEVFNAFHYLDHCIGQFIDSLRQLPVWDNTLVVILPDHGYRYQDIGETTRLYNHIPLIWSGGAIRGPRQVETLCNQSDLAATLLGQLQVGHEAFTFSRDVMGSNYTKPFAYHTYNDGVTIFETDAFMAYDLEARQMIAHEGERADSLLQQARALLQKTSHDLIAK